ncbi:MAG: hypothetical protein H6709_20110 [Kofleriaceae bacterium]|nr:hypothetical protein [Kofleriaceae bacterium]MCB9574392.1 hypothetical protein [Kofleriaceae bacterium]
MTPPFTAPFSTLASFADLCDYLREEGIPHAADVDAHVVELTTRLGDAPATLMIRWEWRRPLIQLIQVAVVDVAPAREADVEHLLARLNHAAPVAGYALDPDRRFVYFRLTLQRDERDQVTVPALNRALLAAVGAAQDAVDQVRAIARPQPSLIVV